MDTQNLAVAKEELDTSSTTSLSSPPSPGTQAQELHIEANPTTIQQPIAADPKNLKDVVSSVPPSIILPPATEPKAPVEQAKPARKRKAASTNPDEPNEPAKKSKKDKESIKKAAPKKFPFDGIEVVGESVEEAVGEAVAGRRPRRER